ncbi:hypothetical protein VPHD249_0101 [Vibrio phage D249]|nr:hypothetical protein SIPHO036v1_90007 [Vibrio phage 70E38.1]QZI88000.1 hypothetical protein SIPHO041v1_p0089 [Vibrio phage 234P1]QZI88172.1 hypothetical protein SIPHO035v1_p0081 [Vibrio phage 234P7B]QZI88359.1 hypothetical protein SIPHO082v1_p0082 [Vibrio phage 294E48.1]QZI88540.1 hypothetical protein SIPHO037v1_p0099 [Vibrio phage 70E35.2]QZI88724.1 hypothetical protein SIPHO039v1_p0095 [Vibrio phage 70E35.5a]QZI88907.1 hypothetical protein SIPHO040v1_p0094 [Vibrio phage 70E35.6]QZI89113
MTICGCLRVLVIALAYFGERTKEPILNIIERSSYTVVEVGASVISPKLVLLSMNRPKTGDNPRW